MLILGIKRSSGEYEGNKYDNIVCHCKNPDTIMMAGEAVEIVKVPYTVFSNFLEGAPLETAIGLDVIFYYNRWNKVQTMQLIK